MGGYDLSLSGGLGLAWISSRKDLCRRPGGQFPPASATIKPARALPSLRDETSHALHPDCSLSAALGRASPSPNSADAYWWHGAGVGIGGLYRSLDYPTERRVPYFAAHPPVYYSQPVPRTYGYSPFAYTPDTRTPDVIPAQPVEIVNPYVKPSSAATDAPKAAEKPSAGNRTISTADAAEPTGPLTIINPFVTSREI